MTHQDVEASLLNIFKIGFPTEGSSMGREFWLPEKSIASRQEPCSQVPEHRHRLCRHHIRALPVRIGGFSTFTLLSCYSSYRPTSWLNNIQRQRLLLTQDRHSFQSLLLQSVYCLMLSHLPKRTLHSFYRVQSMGLALLPSS